MGWQCMPIILVLRMLRQENHQLKLSLSVIVTSCLKNDNNFLKSWRDDSVHKARSTAAMHRTGHVGMPEHKGQIVLVCMCMYLCESMPCV